MKEKKERLLRLWKIRQEQEGYDVSGVKTLEEAEHFFDKKTTKKGASKKTTKKGASKKTTKKVEEPVVEEVEIPAITEEEVQAVANAIVEEATENDKTVEEVVTEIVEESKETPVEGE